MERIEQRLWKADVELASARAHVSQCRARFIRLRTVLVLYEKMCESGEEDPVLRSFWDRARNKRVRLSLFGPLIRGICGQGSVQTFGNTNYNRQAFGLALTWGLTHVDEL